MIGSYVSDDFYFYIEDRDIKLLSQGEKIKGKFAILGQKNILKLYCRVHPLDEKHLSTRISFSLNSDFASVDFAMSDFEEWVINPDDWILENGPNWRDASQNVYLFQERSLRFHNPRLHKGMIERLISLSE